jgi:hypothetical protein
MGRPRKIIPGPLTSESPAEQIEEATAPIVRPLTGPVAPEPGFVPLVQNTSGEKEIEIMRFKSDVQNLKRNSAWKKNAAPDIEEIDHRHFWDTLNRRGEPNTHAVAKNGHTHYMKYELSPDGKSIKVTCGPALKAKNGTGPSGKSKLSYSPVFLYMEDDPENGGTRAVNDTHIHAMTYIKTEKVLIRTS